MTNMVRFGDALPIAALGLSAMFAFDDSRPRLSETGVAALEAGALAFVASTGLKYAVGRARPDSGEAKDQFNPGESDDKWHSFPSRHTAVMWAAVTPYAKEYDMPWLYGLAAITNARAHRQPRALVLRHRRRLAAGICARPSRLGGAPRQEEDRAVQSRSVRVTWR